jgi:heme exporter protein D
VVLSAKVKFAVSIVQKLEKHTYLTRLIRSSQKRQAHLQAADRQGKYSGGKDNIAAA